MQYSLIRSLLIGWTQDLRRAMPAIVLHLEVDYSAQIMRDISAGKIDMGIVYAPQYLPDLSVENIGVEEYVMISIRTSQLAEVLPEEYIRVGYTPGFEKQHDASLTHLSHPPLMAGCEDLAVELLTTFGGSVYVARFVADAMVDQHGVAVLVADAPPILQPVYSVVHFRKRNTPNVQQALRLLHNRRSPYKEANGATLQSIH